MCTKQNGKNYIHKIDVDDVIMRRRRQDISLHKENGTHVKLLHQITLIWIVFTPTAIKVSHFTTNLQKRIIVFLEFCDLS